MADDIVAFGAAGRADADTAIEALFRDRYPGALETHEKLLTSLQTAGSVATAITWTPPFTRPTLCGVIERPTALRIPRLARVDWTE